MCFACCQNFYLSDFCFAGSFGDFNFSSPLQTWWFWWRVPIKSKSDLYLWFNAWCSALVLPSYLKGHSILTNWNNRIASERKSSRRRCVCVWWWRLGEGGGDVGRLRAEARRAGKGGRLVYWAPQCCAFTHYSLNSASRNGCRWIGWLGLWSYSFSCRSIRERNFPGLLRDFPCCTCVRTELCRSDSGIKSTLQGVN